MERRIIRVKLKTTFKCHKIDEVMFIKIWTSQSIEALHTLGVKLLSSHTKAINSTSASVKKTRAAA